MAYPPSDLADRLLARIEIDPDSGCWSWVGYLGESGYGRMSVNGKMQRTHRLSYEAFVGPIPDGLTIDHLCFNKRCLNPAHLEAVTQHENTLRHVRRKTECSQGHSWVDENIYVDNRGGRRCRECHRTRSREWMRQHYEESRRRAS